MTKKLLTLALAGLLLNLFAAVPVRASTKEEKQARFAEQVKEGVKALGVGEASRVKLKLRDKTRLKGYVSEIGEHGFSVTDAKGATTTVAYAQVKQVKGHNLSTGAKIALGAGIFVGVVLLLILIFHDSLAGS